MSERALHANTEVTPGSPLTHYGYSVLCSRLALQRRVIPVVHVQMKRQGVQLCGRIVGLAESAPGDVFKVATEAGPFWVAGRNVRVCSGDGLCQCERSADGAGH